MNETNYVQQSVREHIMALIEVNNTPVIGKTLFVYMMFTIFKEISPELQVPFFPYQLGPYSNVVSHEFNWLVKNGYIEISKKGRNFNFTCAEKGKGFAKTITKSKMDIIAQVKSNSHTIGLPLTIEFTRSNYPEYMINSRV